jgi:hypothetical protein
VFSDEAALLWSCYFAVLFYWGLVSLAQVLFRGARSEIHQLALCCQHDMLFTECFSILQHCLTLDVAHWLRR